MQTPEAKTGQEEKLKGRRVGIQPLPWTEGSVAYFRSPRSRFGKRRTAEQSAYHACATIRKMLPYALCRLRKSKGRPVSLNQSAMAEYFEKKNLRTSKRKRGLGPGPTRRTINRVWEKFAEALWELGYDMVRVHSLGVGINGKGRKGTKQRKLGYICFSIQRQAAGNDIYRYGNQQADPYTNVKRPFRWTQNRHGALLPEAGDPQVSTESIQPPYPLTPILGAGRKNLSKSITCLK